MEQSWLDTLTKQKSSQFTISGKIVDETGQPVDKVTVYIDQHSFINIGESRSERSKQTVDSNFKLELSGGSGIVLSFHKNDYYDVQNVQYSLELSKKTLGFSSNVIIADNQRIVLEHKGKLAKCKRRNTPFFIRKEQRFTSFFIPKLEGNYNKEDSFSEIPNLPNGTIYPNAERDKNDKIIKVVIHSVGATRWGPRTVSLNMVGGDNDGFILIKEPLPHGIINIKDAPESGYVKQMVFHWPEDMQKTFYCYYKFGDNFGKGKINGFSCTADGEVMIGFELYQNIESSSDPKVRRNLRTND